jgi:hypothetical protein
MYLIYLANIIHFVTKQGLFYEYFVTKQRVFYKYFVTKQRVFILNFSIIILPPFFFSILFPLGKTRNDVMLIAQPQI